MPYEISDASAGFSAREGWMDSKSRLKLRVTDVRCEAKDVLVVELADPESAELPRFTAGAHLEVYLPNGLVRHYSLCNDPDESHRYCLGIGLPRHSRGGSAYIHRNLRVGITLEVSEPRNNFPFVDGDEACTFIAGGIGITPIMAMIRTCIARRRPWQLYYCARSRQRAAFYEELLALAPGRCRFHFDDEQKQVFDVFEAIESLGLDTHLYTCGPAALMEAVEAETMERPPSNVHFEWFSTTAVEHGSQQAFTVVLRRSGKRIEVPPGVSILEALEKQGEGIPYSCREGLCATCRVDVLSGMPDHRDRVLTQAEKAAGDQILICVSRSLSPVLELDL
jgi:vanillate O-demethylase ferredoxin subunit